MYKFILENSKGDQLTFNQIGGAFSITEIEGLNPPNAIINTSEVALIDGQMFDSSKLDMRTLDIAFAIEKEAAKNRIEIYKVLKTKQPVKAYYSNAYRNVFIEGYVESVDISQFEMKQVCTVSIICPNPYWKSAQTIIDELSQVIGVFHFPFFGTAESNIVFSYLDPTASVEIENSGDVQTGIVITLQANAAVSDPKIIDYITGDFIELNFDMQAQDVITIDTRMGAKTITLLRNGVETNIFNSLVRGSTWLQLDYNGGIFTYDVGSGNAIDMLVMIRHTNVYEGV